MHGTETGRCNSSKPNIENLDPRIRAAVCSRFPNGRLIHPDLSQLEYRLIAHASGEPKLIRAFTVGEDIHDNMYRMLFGKDPKTSKERKDGGKTPNYISIYGGGYAKFRSQVSSLDEETCKKIYYGKLPYIYPRVNAWKKEVFQELHRRGCLTDLFGLHTRAFDPRDFPDRQAMEREGFNWIIQRSGHCILMVFLMDCMEGIGNDALLVDEVHDDFLLDTPAQHVKSVASIVKRSAQELNTLIYESFQVRMRVPITADVEILKWWK